MLPRLRLKKTRRRLISKSKGFSSIVGAVFAVLVMISLISAVFVWSLSQNTLYNNAVRQTNQADLDRSNERIVTNAACYGDGLNTVWVNGTLENDGPLSVRIVTLWVVNANNTARALPEYAFKPVDMTLSPGGVTTLSGSTLNVNLLNSAGDSLSYWFMSERGNTISKYGTIYNFNNTPIIQQGGDTATSALVASGIGAFGFDFTSFRYYNVSGGKLLNFIDMGSAGDLGKSCMIPWGSTIAFSFNITNVYPTGQNLTLDSRCEMWSYFPAAPGQATGPLWYIANVNPTNGAISPSYTTINLFWNTSTTVYFAIQDPAFQWRPLQKNQLGAINLLMYGTFVGAPFARSYAQNIPFISVLATDG